MLLGATPRFFGMVLVWWYDCSRAWPGKCAVTLPTRLGLIIMSPSFVGCLGRCPASATLRQYLGCGPRCVNGPDGGLGSTLKEATTELHGIPRRDQRQGRARGEDVVPPGGHPGPQKGTAVPVRAIRAFIEVGDLVVVLRCLPNITSPLCLTKINDQPLQNLYRIMCTNNSNYIS